MKKKKPVDPTPVTGVTTPVGMFPFDPMGSYTGVTVFDDEPVQDADDL